MTCSKTATDKAMSFMKYPLANVDFSAENTYFYVSLGNVRVPWIAQVACQFHALKFTKKLQRASFFMESQCFSG
jgi:hypothetical protein